MEKVRNIPLSCFLLALSADSLPIVKGKSLTGGRVNPGGSGGSVDWRGVYLGNSKVNTLLRVIPFGCDLFNSFIHSVGNSWGLSSR